MHRRENSTLKPGGNIKVWSCFFFFLKYHFILQRHATPAGLVFVDRVNAAAGYCKNYSKVEEHHKVLSLTFLHDRLTSAH